MTLEGEGPLLLLLLLLVLLEDAFEAPEEEEVTVLGEAREERTSLPALFQAACFSSARTRSLRRKKGGREGGREGGKSKQLNIVFVLSISLSSSLPPYLSRSCFLSSSSSRKGCSCP